MHVRWLGSENAIGMYHAHNHAQVQVIRGMFGVIRIGDNPIPRGTTISGVHIPDDVDLRFASRRSIDEKTHWTSHRLLRR